MNGPLTLGAAWLLGLAASGHCVLMCGGISAALGVATARDARGRPRPLLLLGYQLGRICSYALAGLLVGGLLGGFIALLDIEAVRSTLRVLSALAFLWAALVAFGLLRDPGAGFGQRLWARLAPLGRRLLPVSSLPRALAFGMVWGWMPCGFVYTVLLLAATQLDAAGAALTMALFGLGTLPALLATSLGANHLTSLGTRSGARRLAGIVLLASALLTLAGPWLPGGWMPGHMHLH